MLSPNLPELWSVRPAAPASIYWKSIFKTKPGKVLQLNSGVLLGTDIMVFPPPLPPLPPPTQGKEHWGNNRLGAKFRLGYAELP
jgi:hypothetical protein